MRRKGVKKEETRAKILDAANRGFRKFGYSGIGIDGLAKSVGVTSGAFYSHFGSKNAAFEKALNTGLDEVINIIPDIQNKHGEDWVRWFCEYYLSKAHREDLECGCAMASLTPEVIRLDEGAQVTFERKMKIITFIIAEGLSGSSMENRTKRAWAMLSILIGGLNLTRAMSDHSFTEEIAQTLVESAVLAAKV